MKANRFFLDTAYVLALLNPNDIYHKQAEAMLPSMHSAREVWITEAILIEIGNALSRSNRIAAAAFINSCYITPNVRVVSVDTSLLKRALDFYNNRGDKEWGLTDCISFLVMTDQGLKEALTTDEQNWRAYADSDSTCLKEALTTDEHFQQAGFRALLLD